MAARDNRSRYALLGALALGPMSGYDIKKFLDGSVANFWRESFGQIYPMLADLERDGLVAGAAASDAGRRKRVYAITPAGRDALVAWLAQPPAAPVPRVELLLKLFFARQAGPDVARQLLDDFRAAQRRDLAHYAAVEDTIARAPAAHPDRPYWLATLDYGRRTAEAQLAWADATLSALDTVP